MNAPLEVVYLGGRVSSVGVEVGICLALPAAPSYALLPTAVPGAAPGQTQLCKHRKAVGAQEEHETQP